MSLRSVLLKEYADVDNRTRKIQSVPRPDPKVESPYRNFDFLSGEEFEILPIHEVETNRELYRRRALGTSDITLTHDEFATMVGVDFSSTQDPVDGLSILHCSASKRSYYGDPVEEAYRSVRYALGDINCDERWLKQKHLIGDPLADELFRVQHRTGCVKEEGSKELHSPQCPFPPEGHLLEDTAVEKFGTTSDVPKVKSDSKTLAKSSDAAFPRKKRPSIDSPESRSQMCIEDPDSCLPHANVGFSFRRPHASTPQEDIFQPVVSPVVLESKPMELPEGIPSFKQKFLSKQKTRK